MDAKTETRLSANETLAMEAWRDCEWGLYFRGVRERCSLPEKQIRRTVRALARKGMVELMQLFNEETGEVAGSGYVATPKGTAYLKATVIKKGNQ